MAAASGTEKTIVVVDDHEDTLKFMRAALERGGFNVRTATDGHHALVLLRERRADLLITDIFMPRQSGFETISRSKAEFPQVKIIVVSAGTIPGMEHDFLSATAHLGVGATLRKPFTAEALLDTVRKVLGQ